MVGKLRLQVLYTPGHTRDSMCLRAEDRLFTGDTLLIGGTGRTDLPSGDDSQLYDSLFNVLLRLDPALKVFPAHDYKHVGSSTLGRELEFAVSHTIHHYALVRERLRGVDFDPRFGVAPSTLEYWRTAAR